MGNVFDGIRDTAFDVVTTTMGYDASWVPSDNSQPGGYTARVLFNNPTEKQKLSGLDYDPYAWKMEYRKDFFPGLKAAVDNNLTEVVTIESQEYYVRAVYAKYDGNMYEARLEPKLS